MAVKKNKMIKKKRRKQYTSQQLLLSAIMKYWGGPTDIAEHLNEALEVDKFSRQSFVNWRLRGYIPLKEVGKIATALEIDEYALNFIGIKEFYDDEETEWPDVVKGLEFLRPKQVEEILEAKWP